MVPFGGWDMPVQYTSILEEARNVRAHCGLFDLCHMGRFVVRGDDAEALCQKVLTNDITKIKPGVIRYALLTKADGGVLDDVLIYRNPEPDRSKRPTNDGEFFLVVNAGNRDRDLEWMRQHARGLDCTIEDRSEALAMIALQGPASVSILDPLTDFETADLGYYKWTHGQVADLACSVSRTGYTGEDGFEIYYPAESAAQIWNIVLEAGRAHGLAPTGLGARDTLRLEAGMALYGHELRDDINPLEARLGWAVKLGTNFVGRDALAKVKEHGPSRLLVGLTTESRRVPRQDYPVVQVTDEHHGEEIGWIASGTFSPVLDCNIATAYVRADLATPEAKVGFRVRDRIEVATICKLPFYKRG